jgi:hypothetical protein
MFSCGCREEDYHRSFFPGCYVLDNGDTLGSDIDTAGWLLFSDILVLTFLTMFIDYFSGCRCAHSLDIAAQIQIMGETSLEFIYGFLSIFDYVQENRRLYL